MRRSVAGAVPPPSTARTGRRLVFPLTGHWIEDRTDPTRSRSPPTSTATTIQSLTGIRGHYESAVRAGKAPQAELSRRYELQADCLSGVFLGSVWQLTRPYGPRLGGAAGGDQGTAGTTPTATAVTARGTTRARWLERGYRTRLPQRLRHLVGSRPAKLS